MKKPTAVEPSMLLFTSFWQDKITFKLMPISEACPFVEVIYDPGLDMLVVINKQFKESFHNVPKMDDNGDIIMIKSPRKNGKPFREERRAIDTYQEYYVTEKEEQINLINMFAVNADDFDFAKYMDSTVEEGK
jgi:hypothetical protein